MRTSFLFPLALAFAATGCAGSDSSVRRSLVESGHGVPSGIEAYGQGKAHLLNGRYGLAVGSLRAALRSHPGSPEILNALAVSYEHLGRKDIAQMYFAQALAIDPGSVQTLNNVARSLMQGGSPALAGTYLQRAAGVDPQNLVVRSNLDLLLQGPAPAAPVRQVTLRERAVWIERTTPLLQTLVTRPAEPAAVEDAALLPLVSFVQVSATQEVAPPEREVVVLEEALAPAAKSPRPPAVLSIANGNGRTGMAARLGMVLGGKGWNSVRVKNADHFGHSTTTIGYRVGFLGQAQDLAAELPVVAVLSEKTDSETDLELRIGKDFLAFDRPF